MDIEDKIRRLEVQFLSTNQRISELTSRVVRVEELVTRHILGRPALAVTINQNDPDLRPEELYHRLSSLAYEFNSMLPDLAEVLSVGNVNTDADTTTRNSHNVSLVCAQGKITSGMTSSGAQKNVNLSKAQIPNSVDRKFVPVEPKPLVSPREGKKVNSHAKSTGENIFLKDKQNVPGEKQQTAGAQNAARQIYSINLVELSSHQSSNMAANKPKQQQEPLLIDLLTNHKQQSKVVESSKGKPKVPVPLANHKPVQVFDENPWEDLEKIPWEGTENIDPDAEIYSKSQSVDNPLEYVKKSPVCSKPCGNFIGHPCKNSHDPLSPCPPCTVIIKNFKLKCNHRIDIMCHRQSKVSDFCSECDSRRLVKVDQEKPAIIKPVLSLTMDPIQSESEVAFRKVKEILNKLTSSNFEKLSDEFMTIVNAQTKFLPEIACVLIEKAMMDAENPLSPANYAKLASKTINRPEGELKMFRIEVVTLITSVFSALLYPNGHGIPNSLPLFVKSLLNKKEINGLGPKRRMLGVLRFVGELFNQEVITVVIMEQDVINPLIAKPTDENLDYLCKLLTLVGHKIEEKVAGASWYDQIFLNLRPFCENSALSSQVRFSIQNLLDLKESKWDRFSLNKPAGQVSLKSTVNSGSTTSLFSNGSNTSAPVASKPKKARKKKAAKSEGVQIIPSFATMRNSVRVPPSDIFDPWASGAPWGEHTDPLAVAFPRLDSPEETENSPSASGVATPADQGWRGSQVSLSFAKAVSSNSSRVISPAYSTSSLNSTKSTALLPEINAGQVFQLYMKIHTAPQKDRINLLSRKLSGAEEKQLRDFIRALSRRTLQLTKRLEIAGIGLMIDVLIRAQIVSEDLVSKGFQSGVVGDLPFIRQKKPTDFEDAVLIVATVVVTIWSERTDNFLWLVELGRNIHKYPETWNPFCKKVMEKLLERKKIKFVRDCYHKTPESGQDVLRKSAVALQVTKQ